MNLPIEKGVVLLDIGFTQSDPNHGEIQPKLHVPVWMIETNSSAEYMLKAMYMAICLVVRDGPCLT